MHSDLPHKFLLTVYHLPMNFNSIANCANGTLHTVVWKWTLYKVRVALSKPIHAITARIGPPGANHGSFIAKPSSCNLHSTLQATPPNLASNPRFPFRILSRSFGKKLIFSKVARQNPERKAWVRGYTQLPLSHIISADAEPPASAQRLFLSVYSMT